MRATPDNWLLAEPGGKPTGPWTREQVLQKIRSGQLGENLLCWQPGMSEWLPVTAIPLFRKEFASHSQPTDSISRPVRGAVVGAGPSSEAGGGVKAWPDDFSARDHFASYESSAPLSRRKSPPTLFLWITVPLVLVLLPAAAFVVWHALTNSGPTSDGSSSSNKTDSNSPPLARLVEQYLAELKEINKPEYPQATREKMLAEADAKFGQELKKLEKIELRGRVRDVDSSRSLIFRNLHQIIVDGPEELQKLSTEQRCSSLINLFVRLSEDQLSQIQKGEAVRCVASITDVYKKEEDFFDLPMPFGELRPPKSNLRLEVRPVEVSEVNNKGMIGPLIPPPPPAKWVIVFGSDSTCSIGNLEDIQVIGDDDSPQIKEQRKTCQSLFEKGDYPKTLEEVGRLLRWVPEDPWGLELREKTERILECIAAAKKAEESGDYAAAYEHWKKASEINPADANLKNELDRVAKKLIEERSKLAESLHSEAERLIRQDKYEDAILIFRSLVQMDLSSEVLWRGDLPADQVSKELSNINRLLQQGNNSEAASVFRKLLQSDQYSDVRSKLVQALIARAESLINQEKFKEACSALENARGLDTSLSWARDALTDLDRVSQMATLHGEINPTLLRDDLLRAWRLVKQLFDVTRDFRLTNEEEWAKHLPSAVPILKDTVKRFQAECKQRFSEIARQLVERNLRQVERLDIEDRTKRAEAQHLLQEVFVMEEELRRLKALLKEMTVIEDLHEKFEQAKEFQHKITEFDNAQGPDLTGNWLVVDPDESFPPGAELKIEDKGPCVSVILEKDAEWFGQGKLQSLQANLQRNYYAPRRLVGDFEAYFVRIVSKFDGQITLTIPEGRTDEIQVRFSNWQYYDREGRPIRSTYPPRPYRVILVRASRREPEPEPEPLFWQPGRVPDFPGKTFP